jgi:hypothetical protein
MIRRAAVVGLVLGVAVSAAGQDRPTWFDRVQLFQNAYGYYLYPDPSVMAAPFTGEPWGVFFPNNWVTKPLLQSEVDAWHANQGVYMASMNPTTAYDNTRTDLDSSRMLDLSGQPVTHSITNSPEYTLSSPLWQTVFQKAVKDIIDFGADGIHIDDITGPSNLLFSWNPQPASFDTFTMTAFRDYLRNKYSDASLTARFGIADPSTFDYGAWIRANHQETTWNLTPFLGLAAEFYTFRILETKRFVHDTVAFVHQYGSTQLGRPFTVSGNIAFDTNSFYLLDELDYFVNEVLAFDTTFPKPFGNVDIKTFKGIRDWPVAVLWEPWESGLPKSTTNMIRLAMADVYASGGTISFNRAFTDWDPDRRISIDYSVLRRYAEFILGHHELYENLHTASRVALVSSMASRSGWLWPCDGGCVRADDPYGPFGAATAFYGIAQLLIDTNTQFDVVFAPDTRFSNLPAVTLGQLRKYTVVILPDTFALDDSQVSTILDYARGGGVVVASGTIGTHLPGGALANRPELAALQATDGDHAYGSGHFVYTRQPLGQDYIRDKTKDPATLRQQLLSLLAPYAKPDVVAPSVSAIYRYGGVTAFVYNDPSRNYIVHLVNYDYDEFHDQFAAKQNVAITLQSSTAFETQALYLSPDSPDRVLETVFSPDGTSLTIPTLEAYGILVLRPLGRSSVVPTSGRKARPRAVLPR